MAANDNVRFKFFLPDARILSTEEVAALPAEKKAAANAAGKEGLWIEIYCPDASCLDEQGHISIPSTGKASEKEKGTWLKLFCPEGQCEITQSTGLP